MRRCLSARPRHRDPACTHAPPHRVYPRATRTRACALGLRSPSCVADEGRLAAVTRPLVTILPLLPSLPSLPLPPSPSLSLPLLPLPPSPSPSLSLPLPPSPSSSLFSLCLTVGPTLCHSCSLSLPLAPSHSLSLSLPLSHSRLVSRRGQGEAERDHQIQKNEEDANQTASSDNPGG